MQTGGEARNGIRLTDKQRLAWLRLIRSDNVGPATFRDLIEHFGSAERAIESLPELSRRGGARRDIRVATLSQAEDEIERATRFGARFVGMGEPDYPPALRHIDGAPPLLAVAGNIALAEAPAVGIVGSRNASASGVKFAGRIARDLGDAGYSVVSGLARGIDAGAHWASLATGTISAMAGGLDRPYPPENRELYEKICAGEGLAVSEMPMGWEPRARDFPRRNRLIAGIALGVVVIEAAERSGSLITARRAGDFGRLVFAVPGSPLDPRASGANQLIREGAILTTGAHDVIEALAPVSRIARSTPLLVEENAGDETAEWAPPGESDRALVRQALGPSPVDIDDIIRHTGLSTQTVHYVLLELDLGGHLARQPGGLVALFPD